MNLAEFDLDFLETVPAVIGVDEAGRGPLAGPVCAAAVYLDKAFYESRWAIEFGPEINDSKQLKETAREKIFDAVEQAKDGLIHFACHMVTVKEIEKLNILGATRKAMALCIDELRSRSSCNFSRVFEGQGPPSQSPARQASLFQETTGEPAAQILVDGKPLKPFPHPHTAIVKGDAKSLAIALASIIAKVTRDRYMLEQAESYPEYGFTSNKGYGTPKHIAAIKSVGPCKIHRMSFLSQILSV
jgi:ribonuclease HII